MIDLLVTVFALTAPTATVFAFLAWHHNATRDA